MQNNPMEFLKEAAIMHTIDHGHIVRLYGVVLDTNSLMLVSLFTFFNTLRNTQNVKSSLVTLGDGTSAFTLVAGMPERAGAQTKFPRPFLM